MLNQENKYSGPFITYLEGQALPGGGVVKCPHCKRNKEQGYSFCKTHIKLAREYWRSWSLVRKQACLCVKCDSKSALMPPRGERPFRYGVYCSKHVELNRKTCLNWSRSPAGLARKALEQEAIKNGYCRMLHPHKRKVKNIDGHYCSRCLERQKQAKLIKKLVGSGLLVFAKPKD